MPKKFSVVDLRILWHRYHDSVHQPMDTDPCDANPGDDCYTDTFLDWLAK